MRLSLAHHSVRRFDQPQNRLIQLLRLMPGDTDHQSVVAWHLDVSCDARLRHGIDGFGNQVTMLYATGPVDAVELTVTGDVLTTPFSGAVTGSAEPLPPIFYLRTTEATRCTARLGELARDLAGEGDPLDRAYRLNGAIHAGFTFAAVDGRAHARPASETVEGMSGSTREAAQLFIAAAICLGLPARFVSGYRAIGGGGATLYPHAWAEAHVAGIGWIGFDPEAGESPAETHVRGAIGLDAHGAAFIAEARSGDHGTASDVELTEGDVDGQG
ncbi:MULTISPECIES: transglutaminase family protein [unclassified Sphingomonas]|uniref:transglutaminase family protein n=1 Tax=unclassified Sphingomonas TaxID=196159 RepID=UPI000834E4F6|nr:MULTISPECIES: transglutaminase family protein [unclassified Sphingomonas]